MIELIGTSDLRPVIAVNPEDVSALEYWLEAKELQIYLSSGTNLTVRFNSQEALLSAYKQIIDYD